MNIQAAIYGLRAEYGKKTESDLDGRTPASYWYDGKQARYRESASSGGMLIGYYFPDDDAPVVAGWGLDRLRALRELHISMRLLDTDVKGTPHAN